MQTDRPPPPEVSVDFSGRVTVVTGAGKGIGLGCARAFAGAGAAVALIDLDQDAVRAAAEQLSQQGANCHAYPANVSTAQDVTAIYEDIGRRFGRIDVLVNNAGTHDGRSLEQASEMEWDHIITNNLKSVYLMSHAAIPYLKASFGSIINISSMVGLVGQKNAGAYSASKGGMVALTKNMALDCAPYGIRVNCVCPGWVTTPLVDAWFALQPDEAEARRYVASIHPLGRIASADEIGQVCVFLASSLASFITGVALPVDGGVTLGY